MGDELVDTVFSFATAHNNGHLCLPSVVLETSPLQSSTFQLIANFAAQARDDPQSGLQAENITMAVNTGDHWMTVILDLNTQRWSLFDSLPGRGHAEAVSTRCQAVVTALGGEWAEWERDSLVSCPRQPNLFDCGIYASVIALRLAASVDPDTPIHAPFWRSIFQAMANWTSIRASLPDRFLELPTLEAVQSIVGPHLDVVVDTTRASIMALNSRARELEAWRTAFKDAIGVFNALADKRSAEVSRLHQHIVEMKQGEDMFKEIMAKVKGFPCVPYAAALEQEHAHRERLLRSTRKIASNRLANLQAGWERIERLQLDAVMAETRTAVESCVTTAESYKASVRSAIERFQDILNEDL